MDLNFEDRIININTTLGEIPIGKMSVSTGFLFFLESLAIFGVLGFKFLKKKAGIISTMVVFASLFFLIAYLFDTPLLYDLGGVIPMALPTAIAFFIQSLAILFHTDSHTIPRVIFLKNKTSRRLLLTFIPLNIGSIFLTALLISILSKRLEINTATIISVIIIIIFIATSLLISYNASIIGASIENAEKKRDIAVEKITLLSKFPEKNPNPVMRITTTGKVIFHNDASSPLLESWEFLEGFLHSRKFLTLLKSLKSVPRPQSFDVQILDKFYLVFPVPIENTSSLNIYALDISEREKTTRDLIQSRSKYFGLFNNMLDGYAYHKIITDSNGNPIDYEFLDVNPAFTTLTGMTREMCIGKRITEILPTIRDEPANWIRKYGDVALNGTILTFESYSEPLQEHFAVSAYQPEPNHFVSIFKDVSEKVKAQESLKKLNEDLEKRVEDRTEKLNEALDHEKLFREQLLASSQFKSDFMASMSHELRTPLNSIIGFTDVILERISGEINAEQDKYLTNVKSSAMHLLDLINNILDITKIESGKVELNIVDIPLKQIIDQINIMIKPIYEKKKLTFEIPNITNETVIRVDRLRFKEILFNLLSNAVKYTQEGCIKLEFSEDDTYWNFAVIDTGIGIKEEDFGLIFQDFKRIKSARVAAIEGTGLGLPLTKRLIEYHGGNISFTSEFGKGSTFTFTIPKRKVAI
jgi:PAS domain S-box-containing protein